MWPLGSDHSSRPRRSSRPITAAAPAAWSTTSPPAEVSSTVRSRRRRSVGPARASPAGAAAGGGHAAIVTIRGPLPPRPGGRRAGRRPLRRVTNHPRRSPSGRLHWPVVSAAAPAPGAVAPDLVLAQQNAVVDLVPFPRWPTSWPPGSLPPGTGSTWSAAAVRDALLGRPAVIWTSPPTPARTPCWLCSPAGRMRCGRPASRSARSAPGAATPPWRSPRSEPTPTTG